MTHIHTCINKFIHGFRGYEIEVIIIQNLQRNVSSIVCYTELFILALEAQKNSRNISLKYLIQLFLTETHFFEMICP